MYLWLFGDETGGIDQCLIVTRNNCRADREFCYAEAAKKLGVADVACLGCVEVPAEAIGQLDAIRLDYAYVG